MKSECPAGCLLSTYQPPIPQCMNTRLDRSIDDARAALSTGDQDQLAELFEAYVASHADALTFTEDELVEIRRRLAEPFDPAPDDEVREFFARYGLRP
jgi:hypothetical protein